jgi:arginyl-tRNA--protein-N-Asp/Glu arginylyltransferase
MLASASQEADTEVTNPLLGMGKARSKNGEYRTSCRVNKSSAAPDTKTQQ